MTLAQYYDLLDNHDWLYTGFSYGTPERAKGECEDLMISLHGKASNDHAMLLYAFYQYVFHFTPKPPRPDEVINDRRQ